MQPRIVGAICREAGVTDQNLESQRGAMPRRRRRSKRREPAEHSEAGTNILAGSIRPFSEIEIGEPDANAEFFISQKTKEAPLYIRAFYEWNSSFTTEFVNGTKFILFGQKGTGKTAILRHLQGMSSNYANSFIIFRKEIVEEAQLSNIAATFSANVVVDEDKIKSTKFYYHAMKRLMLTFLLAKCESIDEDMPDDVGWFKELYVSLKSSTIGQIAALVTDSVIGSLQAVEIDVERATKGIVSINSGKAIKKSNDAFVKYAFDQFQRSNMKVRLFIDEMHFAYRDPNSLSADSSLVRDTILAVREINERLIDLGLDSMIYISIRSEFLEHQEIAAADVAHTIESYGVELSWENAPYDRAHPIFSMMLARLKVSLGEEITRDAMIARYIPVGRITDFLEYTWGKPRDIVRYFKAAKAAYPNGASIRRGNEFGNVIRRYSQAAWQDVKAAIASFVPKNSIPILEEALQKISSHNFDSSKRFDRKALETALSKPYAHMQKEGVGYDIGELIKLLYIIGVLYIKYRDAGGQEIIHQFHRGNRHPYPNGYYYIHRAVARALS